MAGLRRPKPGDLLRIVWADHIHIEETWLDIEKDKSNELALVTSYGVLLKDEPLYYTIAGSYCSIVDEDGKTTQTTYGDVNKILKAGIQEIKRIKV